MIVTGPSLTRATFMSAPNLPVSTRAPRRRSSSTTAVTSGSATGPGAALFQVGRLPLAVSAYSVNWLTTSSGAPMSEQDFSPSRIRSPHSLAASLRALSGGVVVGDADQDEQARLVDRPDDLAVDGDAGLGDPLRYCSHERSA